MIKQILLASLLFTPITFANSVHEAFPDKVKPQENYVFYSHGFIVEGTNPTPKNERWGIYEFPAVKEALSDPSYHLIAYHRPKGTKPFDYAKKLASDVNKLIAQGVDAKNITIVGFSRGAFITSITSHHLADTPVNTVLLAGCGRILSKKYQEIKINGDFLSIYETTDGAKSCQRLAERSDNITSFEELAISTGEEHGAFYRPYLEWIKPLKNWIKRKK